MTQLAEAPATSDPLPVAAAAGSLRRTILLAVIVLGGLGAVYASPLRDWLDLSGVERVREWIRGLGPWGPLGLVAITTLGVTLGAPRIFFAALGGVAYGWLSGTALAFTGTLAGCLVTFAYARHLGRGWAAGRFARLQGLNGLFRDHGIVMNLLIRAAPVGNCHVANLIMAVSPIPWRAFVAGTALGILPETIIYALFGSAAKGGIALRVTSAVLMLVALASIYFVISRRSQLARRIGTQLAKDDR